MYKINSTRIDGETITVSVSYTLKDSTILDIEVPFFQPQSVDYILEGIANREISEQQKYDAVSTNVVIQEQLLAEYVDKPITVDADGKSVLEEK
jgi:hypothetical protein